MNTDKTFAKRDLLALLLCVLLLLLIHTAAGQSGREHAKATLCASNLRKLSLAMLLHNTDYGTFPPSYQNIRLLRIPGPAD